MSIKHYGQSTALSSELQDTAHTETRSLRTFFGNIIHALRLMSNPKYWTRVNAVEAWGFGTKLAIIIPGLLFGRQWWWLYIFAVLSSAALIWTSTRKTLPTIIVFNFVWIILALTAIGKHFV